jgi:perosamine synthetase
MKRASSLLGKMNKQNVDKKGIDGVVKVLKSGFLSKPEGGTHVKKFQQKMSKMLDKKFSFATNSGTSSLHAAIVSLNLKKGDEVLVPALTFMADASVVIQEGAKPVFVDISEDDFNMNPGDVLKKITSRTKAMIVVHLYGQPAKIDELIKIAKKSNLVLIEDCAQAMGAKYKNKYVGSFGDISCFSFYQTKNLVLGEGGLISTNSDTYANILHSILNNGIKHSNVDDYDFDHIGFNYQMTEIQAALGLRQLERLEDLNRIRRKYANIYKNILAVTDIIFQKEHHETYNVYCYLTGVLPKRLRKKRDLFIKKVQEQGIPIKCQYPLTLPETQICQKMRISNPSLSPTAVDISKRIVNFYVHPGFKENEIARFAKSILKVYQTLS